MYFIKLSTKQYEEKATKELEVKLLVAINKTLLNKKMFIKNGTGKTVEKAIRKIVKSSRKTKVAVPAKSYS